MWIVIVGAPGTALLEASGGGMAQAKLAATAPPTRCGPGRIAFASGSFLTTLFLSIRASNTLLDRSLRGVRRQWAHADLLEPHDVARVMILQADVAFFGPLWLPFRLVPLLARRHLGAGRIEARDPSPVQFHKDSIARQRD